MDKTRIPTVSPIAEVKSSFAHVSPDRHPHDIPRDRINDGVHPFQAMADDIFLSGSEAARALGMEFTRYLGIITGVADYTTNDILQACDVFQCMPYDFARDNKPLTPEIRNALIFVLESKQDRLTQEEIEEAQAVLYENASTDETTFKIMAMRRALFFEQEKGNNEGDMIADFLDMLIANDGSFEYSDVNGIPEIIEEFRLKRQLEKDELFRWCKTAKVVKAKHWNDLNRLGHRLYPKRNDIISWSETYQYLRQGWEVVGRESRLLRDYYVRTPQSIGRDVWPCFSTTSVSWKNKTYQWRQAQKMHAEIAYGYFQAVSDHTELLSKFKAKAVQIKNFDKFMTTNRDLFLRYQNRQEIMLSPAMPKFMSDMTRMISQRKPQAPNALS